MIELRFVEVRVTPVADTPVLVLAEAHGPRTLPIWITAAGANAILSAGEPADPDHPTTHDLLLDALAVADALVDAVHIVAEDEGVFTASMLVSGSMVAARVSDAVALALRCDALILVDEDLLDVVGLGEAQTVPPGADAPGGPGGEEQVERFRAFLDTINPEDFQTGTGEP